MIAMGEMWSQVGTAMASVMFVYAMVQQYLPYQFRAYFERYTQQLVGFVNPYIRITFPEYTGDGFRRSQVYKDIQTYLSANSSAKANRFQAHDIRDSKAPILGIADNEEVTDEFQGIRLWWTSSKTVSKGTTISWYPASDEKKYYTLTFHRKYREIITGSYLSHILKEGKALAVKNRQRKLFTNSSGGSHWDGGRNTRWSHVIFEHPSTFDTLAMDPKKKEEIINDLIKFRKGKDYYAKIGKAWKRGYLLYGPPGTGKSTMIVAMANFMDYDIYDLELTAVKDNTELRKLLIDTSNKSIIVIEDIDCSLDLTGQRKKEKKKEDEDGEKKDPIKKKVKEEEEEESKKSKVTLSGLLNFIDGIWSACGGERLIIFTTNYVDKLDPALIRRGRMDKHIELSYCSFEAFKVLARNYLDVESHPLFETIQVMLGEINMTPADVAEYIMPNSLTEDADSCLKNLIEALEKTKVEEERKKVEEEMKLNAKKEAEELKAKEEQEKEEKKNEEVAKDEDVKCYGTSDTDHVKENETIAG